MKPMFIGIHLSYFFVLFSFFPFPNFFAFSIPFLPTKVSPCLQAALACLQILSCPVTQYSLRLELSKIKLNWIRNLPAASRADTRVVEARSAPLPRFHHNIRFCFRLQPDIRFRFRIFNNLCRAIHLNEEAYKAESLKSRAFDRLSERLVD